MRLHVVVFSFFAEYELPGKSSFDYIYSELRKA